MKAGGIGDMLDFLAECVGNQVKSKFQCLNDRLLLGENLTLLKTFLLTLPLIWHPAMKPKSVGGAGPEGEA